MNGGKIKKNKKNNKKKEIGGYHERKKIDISAFVSTKKDSECANYVDAKYGIGVCSTPNILKAVIHFNKEDSDTDVKEEEINNIVNNIINNGDKLKNEMNKLKKKLSCNNEICAVAHPNFKKFAIQKHIVGKQELENNAEKRFKIKGPKNSTEWLSNEDIDNSLQDWACTFEDFFPCQFAMIDFDKTNDPLNQYNMGKIYLGEYEKDTILGTMRVPCRTFGCAINTDKHTGNGIHWMALFIDMRPQNENEPWTIEFFNSAGSPPQNSIVEWMDHKKNELEDFLEKSNKHNKVNIIKLYKVEHQMSSTECGLYTLFYIRSRLENVPYSKFLEDEIPDESMMEFRKHCFR